MRDILRQRRQMAARRLALILAVAIPLTCLVGYGVYQLPPVNERLAWRVDTWRSAIKYALQPPEQVVFVPEPTAEGGLQLTQTLTPTTTPGLIVVASPTPGFTETPPGPSATPTPTPTETLTPTPLPRGARLEGIVHEYQRWNNCGPANLAMNLSFWDWQGSQLDTAAVLKPNQRDKNVMPYEMADYVAQHTPLEVLLRVGGDLDLLRALVAAGYPVLIEKGFEGPNFDGWMGHYEVISGYDDSVRRFIAQDSYDGPDRTVKYDQLESQWRAFNFTYLVIFPLERGDEVRRILGPQAEAAANFQYAAENARQETLALTGRDLYFAFYNLGTNLVALQDYGGAATAFDAAFANYPAIPEAERPWRMIWYQTGPYFAYYYTGRYADVINLATATLDAMSEPVLEESYYWRGMAYLAQGEQELAVADFRSSQEVHPGFEPALEQLQALGVAP